ncbi:response regulator [Flaviaesturariibacter terrae]
MKVAVFENEHDLISGIFKAVNLLYFNNQLLFEYYPSSQSFRMERISEYSLCVVDIDLSPKSELDGYGVIARINTLPIHPPIVILTGHSLIEETLAQKGLPKYPILMKSIGLEDTKEAFKKALGIN